MILTSTTETVAYKPRENEPKAPTFYLRAGSVIERAGMEAELAGPHRAGQVYGFELREAARNGIMTLLADDPEMERVLELLNTDLEHTAEVAKALAAGKEAPADPLSADDRRVLVQVREILAEHWGEFRDLDARIQRRRAIAPIVALRRFCVNIEGEGIKFTRGIDGFVSEATLAALDPMEMEAAGNRAFVLQYGIGEEKNSEPPS